MSIVLCTLAVMAVAFIVTGQYGHAAVAGTCVSSMTLAARRPSGWMLAPAGGVLLLVLILAGVNWPTQERYRGRGVPVFVLMLWDGGWSGSSRPDPLSSGIPHHQAVNDFMAALIVETHGFRGLAFCVALLAALLAVVARRTIQAHDPLSTILGAGVFSLIAAQTLVHLAVNLNLVRIRAVPLPFMSHAPPNTAALLILMTFWMLTSRYANRGKTA